MRVLTLIRLGTVLEKISRPQPKIIGISQAKA
jgi:hypothetical protein